MIQNVISPGGEIPILHIYILTQSDRLVNFIQWWAMISACIAVSWLYLQVGGPKKFTLLSSLITAAIPMGIIQASSTVNDYTVSYWILLVAIMTLEVIKTNKLTSKIIYTGIAAGLALWTKPTAVAFILPFETK